MYRSEATRQSRISLNRSGLLRFARNDEHKKEPGLSVERPGSFLSGRKEQARSSAPPLTRSEFEADGAAIGARLAGVARNAARLGDGREDRRQILRIGEVAAPHAADRKSTRLNSSH